MRILISANSFYPAVGGYEGVALTLAQQMASQGHTVRILTYTKDATRDRSFSFEIFRNPSIRTMFRLLSWCEVYVQHNVSFKLLWPILFVYRPLVCVHHTFYSSPTHSLMSWRHLTKHFVTLCCTNISVSNAVANGLLGKSHVIPNPYRDDIFFRIPTVQKTMKLVFVGRMVSDKGLDLLVDAIAKLRGQFMEVKLTVVGSGPEESNIRKMITNLKLETQIKLVGEVTGEKLNELLNAHKIMVVPSRRGETFGIVALEGIACGCLVVGSTCGGLPEAIGKCGIVFECDNSSALAEVLMKLLQNEDAWKKCFIHAHSHLEMHRSALVTEKYLKIITDVGNGIRG